MKGYETVGIRNSDCGFPCRCIESIHKERAGCVFHGARIFSEYLSVDLAFINVTGGDALFPGVPYVDFVYNF